MDEVDDRHFSTVFWMVVIFSSTVAATLSIFADSSAAFFGEPLLAGIIPVLSVLLLINSCEIVQEARLVRGLNFRPLAIRSFTASFVGGAVSRSEEHTSELQSLMRTSYAVFCCKKKISYTHT